MLASKTPAPVNASNLVRLATDQSDFSDMDDFSASNNLLSVFLEYCSIIQQYPKSQTNDLIVGPLIIRLLGEDLCNTTKLCYLILLCVTEDEFANATMHDENVTFSVYLHKAVRNSPHVLVIGGKARVFSV